MNDFLRAAWNRRRRETRTRGGAPTGRGRRVRVEPRAETLEGRTLLSGLPATWTPAGIGGGSVLVSPQYSPFNPNEMYITSEMGQVFHTMDSGATWKGLDFRQVQGALGAGPVEFTEDPSVLYAVDYTSGTWNGHFGNALTRSTDGGATWKHLATDPTNASAYTLLADPNDHNILLVSDHDHLFASRDGGATWAQKFATADAATGLHVAGAFFDGNNVYVGTNDGLLVSADGGASFAASAAGGIPAGQAILSLTGAKQNGVTRLFAVTMNAPLVHAGIQVTDAYQGGQGIFAMDVGAGGWQSKMSGYAADGYPYYVATARNDVNVAYVGGGNAGGVPTVYKTTDGGTTWASVFQSTNNQNVSTGWSGYRGDVPWYWGGITVGFAVDPNDPNRVTYTDWGFAHATTDGGATWRQLYENPADANPAGAPTPKGKAYRSNGLNGTAAWGVNWADPSHIIVAQTDVKMTVSADGGKSFSFNYTGQTYNTLYRSVTEPSTGVVYGAVSTVHDLYTSHRIADAYIDTGGGAVLSSADKGTTWQMVHDFGHPVVWVAADPGNANRLYASVVSSTAGDVYMTNDLQDGAASTWTRLATPPRTQGHPLDVQALADGTLVATYSARLAGTPQDFTDSSGVFVSADGGKTWSDRSTAGLRFWTKDLAVDPNDPTQSTWYAGTFNGWGGQSNGLGGLYKTTDRGLTWNRILGPFNVESATVDPANPDQLFVATESDGLWYSANATSAKPTFTQDPNFPFMHPERVFFNPYKRDEMWVSTIGNGLFVGTAPQSAVRLSVAAPSSATAGVAFGVTVTALDGSGQAVPGYTGTVHFAGGGPLALLPADYTFTAADRGVHAFASPGATLVTAGGQAVTAADAASPAVSGSAAVAVAAAVPAAAASYRYDFGRPDSTPAAGYTLVSQVSAYTPSSGFGWLAGSSVYAWDYGPSDPGQVRHAVYVYGEGSFAADVAAGTYDVTLASGDRRDHDPVQVYLQGVLVDTFRAPYGQVAVRTYRVTVGSGPLVVRLRDPNSPLTGDVAVDTLTVVPVAAAAASPSPVLPPPASSPPAASVASPPLVSAASAPVTASSSRRPAAVSAAARRVLPPHPAGPAGLRPGTGVKVRTFPGSAAGR